MVPATEEVASDCRGVSLHTQVVQHGGHHEAGAYTRPLFSST
jgi:hypothetical protein